MGKITFQDAKELFEKRGYKLLEAEYKNSKTKMRYICPNHPEKENSITYNNLSRGYGCPYCGGTAKLTFGDVKAEFEQRGYTLLEIEYINNRTNMKYECLKHPNKTLFIALRDLKSGKGCAYCAGTAKHTFEEAFEEFSSRGYTLLETTYKNNKHPMRYRCSNHPDKDLKITLHKLLLGQGCVYCEYEKRAGKGNNAWKGGVTDMSRCLRSYIKQWKKEALKQYGNKCYVTGRDDKLEIHHIKPFHVLRDEVFAELNLPIHDTIGEYSQENRERINMKLKEKHSDFVGIPLTKEIHDLFHRIYGRNNTTMKDLTEFKQRFLSGEFDVKLSAI